MIDYSKFTPKLTRSDAFEFYKIWINSTPKPSISKKALELGVCPSNLRSKIKQIQRMIKWDEMKMHSHARHLKNWLEYRWKSGDRWHLSVWSPDFPAKKQLKIEQCEDQNDGSHAI